MAGALFVFGEKRLHGGGAFATLSPIEGQGEVRDGILQSLWAGYWWGGILFEVRGEPGRGGACVGGE